MLNFDWLANLSMGWARFLLLLPFITMLVFPLSLNRRTIYQGANDQSKWRNLKFWVIIIVSVQVALYFYF